MTRFISRETLTSIPAALAATCSSCYTSCRSCYLLGLLAITDCRRCCSKCASLCAVFMQSALLHLVVIQLQPVCLLMWSWRRLLNSIAMASVFFSPLVSFTILNLNPNLDKLWNAPRIARLDGNLNRVAFLNFSYVVTAPETCSGIDFRDYSDMLRALSLQEPGAPPAIIEAKIKADCTRLLLHLNFTEPTLNSRNESDILVTCHVAAASRPDNGFVSDQALQLMSLLLQRKLFRASVDFDIGPTRPNVGLNSLMMVLSNSVLIYPLIANDVLQRPLCFVHFGLYLGYAVFVPASVLIGMHVLLLLKARISDNGSGSYLLFTRKLSQTRTRRMILRIMNIAPAIVMIVYVLMYFLVWCIRLSLSFWVSLSNCALPNDGADAKKMFEECAEKHDSNGLRSTIFKTVLEQTGAVYQQTLSSAALILVSLFAMRKTQIPEHTMAYERPFATLRFKRNFGHFLMRNEFFNAVIVDSFWSAQHGATSQIDALLHDPNERDIVMRAAVPASEDERYSQTTLTELDLRMELGSIVRA